MDPKGVGMKLLKNMGYEPGKGLGKNETGIKAPIQLNQIQTKGIGLGYQTGQTKLPDLICKIDTLLAQTKTHLQQGKAQLETLKNSLFVASQTTAESGKNTLQICQEMHQVAMKEGISFPNHFSSSQLNSVLEFAQTVLYELTVQLIQAGWNPASDKELFFVLQQHPQLKGFHIQRLISIHLSNWIHSQSSLFDWTSVLLEWRPVLEDSFYLDYFYRPIIVEVGREMIQREDFLFHSFVPLLLLDDKSCSIEKMLLDVADKCSPQDALLIKDFISPKTFSLLSSQAVEVLLDKFTHFSEHSPSTIDSPPIISPLLAQWHDLLGCGKFTALLIKFFLVPFQERITTSNSHFEILFLYQQVRNSLGECCLSNSTLLSEMYRTLTLIERFFL